MSAPVLGVSSGHETFDRLLGELRPKLHRYCARMTGSVVDGEDVVQEALVDRDRWLIPKAGYFASRTMRRSIFCAAAFDRTPPAPTRIRI